MKKAYINQTGFTGVEILLFILILVVVGFAGYYVYHSQRTHVPTVTNSTNSSPNINSDAGNMPKFVHYPGSGIMISTASGLDKLTSVSAQLKQYFKDTVKVGQMVRDCGSGGCNNDMVPQELYIDDVYGSYADGAGYPAASASVWGPQADGSIGVLLSYQDGPLCSDLRAKHIPAAFHMQCYASPTAQTYTRYNG